jgi:hypothetical protein
LGERNRLTDKKTLVLAVGISWVLTLVTILLISNFAPNLTQPFAQQFVSLDSAKVVNLQKNEVTELQKIAPAQYYIYLNFSWSPSAPKKNAIFGIVLSFEYKIEPSEQKNEGFSYVLRIPDFGDGEFIHNPNTTGEWETVSFQITSRTNDWPTPNQSEYPIGLLVSSLGTGQTYIRNVNIMLLAIDG